jgi:hypothetical protein
MARMVSPQFPTLRRMERARQKFMANTQYFNTKSLEMQEAL